MYSGSIKCSKSLFILKEFVSERQLTNFACLFGADVYKVYLSSIVTLQNLPPKEDINEEHIKEKLRIFFATLLWFSLLLSTLERNFSTRHNEICFILFPRKHVSRFHVNGLQWRQFHANVDILTFCMKCL